MKAELVAYTPDYDHVLRIAASQSYQKQATDKVIEHIIKAGHWSVLEHCMATFKCKASISTLLQITRHRHLSFTVQSSRACPLNSVRETGIDDLDALIKKSFRLYQNVIVDGKWAYEDCAYLLPKAAEYTFVVTGNFRAWLEYLQKRLCKRTQPEHRALAMEIWRQLKTQFPLVFDRNIMNCDKCTERSCNFA